MREILFRGKTKSGEWVYGDLLYPMRMYVFTSKNLSKDFCLIVETSFAHGGRISVGRKHWVKRDTVGQYTGMKDKNVKEIYEGDAVEAIRYDGLVVTGVVEFRDCSFVINTGYLTIYTWLDYQIEVIGNIHDNPELLVEVYD